MYHNEREKKDIYVCRIIKEKDTQIVMEEANEKKMARLFVKEEDREWNGEK